MFAILISIFALLIYFKILKPPKYWEEKGVTYLKPWPVVGNMGLLCLKKRPFAELLQNLYNAFPEKR